RIILHSGVLLVVSDSPRLASFFLSCSADHRDLHSFPTRRSSDLPDEPDDASWGRNRALVLEAEALGFDSVLVAQHTMNPYDPTRSEEHTSELQSHLNLVCRLLLEKKK